MIRKETLIKINHYILDNDIKGLSKMGIDKKEDLDTMSLLKFAIEKGSYDVAKYIYKKINYQRKYLGDCLELYLTDPKNLFFIIEGLSGYSRYLDDEDILEIIKTTNDNEKVFSLFGDRIKNGSKNLHIEILEELFDKKAKSECTNDEKLEFLKFLCNTFLFKGEYERYNSLYGDKIHNLISDILQNGKIKDEDKIPFLTYLHSLGFGFQKKSYIEDIIEKNLSNTLEYLVFNNLIQLNYKEENSFNLFHYLELSDFYDKNIEIKEKIYSFLNLDPNYKSNNKKFFEISCLKNASNNDIEELADILKNKEVSMKNPFLKTKGYLQLFLRKTFYDERYNQICDLIIEKFQKTNIPLNEIKDFLYNISKYDFLSLMSIKKLNTITLDFNQKIKGDTVSYYFYSLKHLLDKTPARKEDEIWLFNQIKTLLHEDFKANENCFSLEIDRSHDKLTFADHLLAFSHYTENGTTILSSEYKEVFEEIMNTGGQLSKEAIYCYMFKADPIVLEYILEKGYIDIERDTEKTLEEWINIYNKNIQNEKDNLEKTLLKDKELLENYKKEINKKITNYLHIIDIIKSQESPSLTI